LSYSTDDDMREEGGHTEGNPAGPPRDETGAPETTTFPGDTGQLPLDTRRVLVQLLLGPSVDGRRHGNLWKLLLRDETAIQERLHELFLELVIDHEQKVAFTRQVSAEDVEIPILLRRAHLSYLESVLILFLRQKLTQADTQGERAVVSTLEMLEHLSVYEREGNVDHSRFEKQRQGAIDKAKKLSLIQKIRGAEDRFEVSPTLKLLFPAEEIQALTRTYNQLAQHGEATSDEELDGSGQEQLEEGDDE